MHVSLRVRATMAALAIILVALGVTAAANIIQLNRELMAEQRRSVDSIAHSLAQAAELALSVGDDQELTKLASLFIQERNIIFVALYNERGTVLSKATSSERAWTVYEATRAESDEFLVAEKIVETADLAPDDTASPAASAHSQGRAPRVVGKVVVALSTATMYGAQRRQAVLTGWITLLTAFLCAWVTYLMVRSWTRRLDVVVAASEAISRGDYSQSIAETRADEIGRLAQAFEQMRLTVQQRDGELRQLNQTLQQRVDERTRDLDAALKSAEHLAVVSREAEARIRAILDAAADGIITISEEGRVESLNAAAEAIFGYASSEIQNHAITDLIPGMALAPMQNLRAERPGVNPAIGERRELEGKRKDGRVFPMELNTSAVKLRERWLLTGIVRDVTEIKEAQLKLEASNKQLLQASRQAGMAEVATGVLHNVGNVLNSVNVSASLVAEKVSKSRIVGISKAAQLLADHAADLGAFVTSNPSGTQLPAYLSALATHLQSEQRAILDEMALLTKNIEHIKDIVNMQQAYAGALGITEKLRVTELVEDALRMNGAALARHDVIVVREYVDAPEMLVDKHRVLQILVNLIRNAKYALDDRTQPDKRLTVRVCRDGEESVNIIVQDNGIGIPPENLTRIFTHGFSTRKGGHGFGLHSGALAARELGGELTVQSAGVGKGACFTVRLPLRARARFA